MYKERYSGAGYFLQVFHYLATKERLSKIQNKFFPPQELTQVHIIERRRPAHYATVRPKKTGIYLTF